MNGAIFRLLCKMRPNKPQFVENSKDLQQAIRLGYIVKVSPNPAYCITDYGVAQREESRSDYDLFLKAQCR